MGEKGRCHLLIRGGKVVDGSGAPAVQADVAVESSKIAAVGDLSGWQADEVWEAAGRVVAPGFIDVHTHDDLAIFQDRSHRPKLSQGVTTVVAGNCGISIAPFRSPQDLPPPFPLLGGLEDYAFPEIADYRQAFEARPAAVNVGLLTGHGNLRMEALDGDYERAAEDDEIEAMGQRLRHAVAQGSLGLSTGLAYPNCQAAPTAELVGIAKHIADQDDALFCCHMRDEGDDVLEAISETLEIGREGGLAVVISHFKCAGTRNYGRSSETLAALDAAAKTQRVGLDLYPYTASSTSLLPAYIRESEDVVVTDSRPYPEAKGRRLAEIAEEWDCSLADAAERLYPAGAIYFQMSEEDVERIMAYPKTMIGSDGLPGTEHPHPRLWGTFPRVLGRYSRERGVLGLEDAVHRMTGLSAETFRLKDRGLVKPGYAADLVVFDPEMILDRATFEDPKQEAAGIDLVVVNGQPAWRDGDSTGLYPGAFLAR